MRFETANKRCDRQTATSFDLPAGVVCTDNRSLRGAGLKAGAPAAAMLFAGIPMSFDYLACSPRPEPAHGGFVTAVVLGVGTLARTAISNRAVGKGLRKDLPKAQMAQFATDCDARATNQDRQ